MVGSAELLLGDEAVALGAIDAGIGGAFSYAGTPATEIFETVQAIAPEVWAQWSANEKVAYEEAMGMSYAGKRALVSMKHVGLNVASDPFMSSALTGVGAGLVLAVADDPGMHSSQNEQDSRFFADFAKIPCLEPSTQQECYQMTRDAFVLSEQLGIPVMLRLVTRVAHSRANVFIPAANERHLRNEPQARPEANDWTLVPVNARRRFRRLIDLQADLLAESERSPHQHLRLAGKRGILCTGTAYNYVREVLQGSEEDSILRVGMYPAPAGLIRRLVDHCESIVVLEEGYPFLERQLLGLFGIPGKAIHGKHDGTVPPDGELLPSLVACALGIEWKHTVDPDSIVAGRPPQFCKGCPHISSFSAIVDAVAKYPDALVFGDIGCYAMGIMPPFRAIHSCVDMGSSIGLAHGASRAGAFPVLCTIGDSTFAHSGIPPLIDAIHSDANMTVLILDNATTAMTGAQDSYATGETLVHMLEGLGVKDLHIVDPLPKNHDANQAVIEAAIQHKGLSVVIPRRACVRIKVERAAAVPAVGS